MMASEKGRRRYQTLLTLLLRAIGPCNCSSSVYSHYQQMERFTKFRGLSTRPTRNCAQRLDWCIWILRHYFRHCCLLCSPASATGLYDLPGLTFLGSCLICRIILYFEIRDMTKLGEQRLFHRVIPLTFLSPGEILQVGGSSHKAFPLTSSA
jgi:hypothetical protein